MASVERSAAQVRTSKYTKAEVNYQRPALGMDHCRECRHFEVYAKKTCDIVAGEILPGDWCKKFSRRRRP